MSTAGLIRAEPLAAGKPLPLVLRPSAPAVGVDLVSWAADHRELLQQRLLQHGGLLMRGFGISTAERLQAFIRAVAGDPLDYQDRATPRQQVGDKIYTSTDYPADQTIELHNENCYASEFPMKIFFCCETAAREGGETPLADCRQVYREIAPEIRQCFARHGVMYVRNFIDGLGLSWQEVFQTDDKEEMANFCRRSGIDFEWLGDGRLQTRQVRPALARHPRSGESLWFNQAVAFHVSTLEPSVRERLVRELGEDGVPKTAMYGDGSAIESSVLEALRLAYRRATVAFPWQEGDLLMLDNLLTAHGRWPFVGPRKVLAGMAQSIAGAEVWS